MNGIELTQTPPADIVYPESDGQPVAETGVHMLVIVHLIATLRQHFRQRPDVYVTGDMFVYYEEGHPESRKAPDVMVIKGVTPGPERRSFKVWEEGAIPTVIFEITSKATADEDRQAKRDLYQRLGVREYILFDPLHEYLEQPLMGYRLINREYEPMLPAGDRGLNSLELGVRIVPEGTDLGLFLFRTRERIPTPPEAYRLLEETQQMLEDEHQRAEQEQRRADEERRRAEQERRRAEQERRRADEERRRAEQEQRRADEAEKRAAELERELERWRTIPPPSSGPSAPTGGDSPS